MTHTINENNIKDLEQIIQLWLDSKDDTLTLVKNPTNLDINVFDEIKADGGLV